MADDRPSKRRRTAPDTGAYRDVVPFGDDYDVIHSRKIVQRQVRSTTHTAHTECSAQPNISWDSTMSWAPINNPNYALDTDEELYNDMLEADVMDDISAQQTPLPQKKKQSLILVSSQLHPHYI